MSLSNDDNLFFQNQLQYAEMLLAIGNGTYLPDVLHEGYFSDKTRGVNTIELPNCNRIVDKKQAINYVFTSVLDADSMFKNAILAGTNDDVDEWNEQVQTLNSFTAISSDSYDELAESDDPHDILRNMLTDEMLNNYNKNGIPPHIFNSQG